MKKTRKHIVQSGDNLWSIGYKYKVNWEDIYNANKDIIKHPQIIYVGQELVIPRRSFKNFISSFIVLGLFGVCLWGSICFLEFVIKSVPQSYHYEYIDTNGNVETSKDCRSIYGTLYCGDKDTAIKVVEVKKVWE